MGEERDDKLRITNFEYGCGDGTGGAMAAKNQQNATERAQAICRVHDGVEDRLHKKPGLGEERAPE